MKRYRVAFWTVNANSRVGTRRGNCCERVPARRYLRSRTPPAVTASEGNVSEPVCGERSGECGNKNPEVVLLRHLNRQFALDPRRPVFAVCLRTPRTILTWAPGLLPTGFRLNASGSYLAFDLFLVLSTDGSLSTVAVPLLPLRCRRGAVNWLRSRTHHQPENLGNCQRTIVVLLFPLAKSIKISRMYRLYFQRSAARPQACDRKWCNFRFGTYTLHPTLRIRGSHSAKFDHFTRSRLASLCDNFAKA